MRKENIIGDEMKIVEGFRYRLCVISVTFRKSASIVVNDICSVVSAFRRVETLARQNGFTPREFAIVNIDNPNDSATYAIDGWDLIRMGK